LAKSWGAAATTAPRGTPELFFLAKGIVQIAKRLARERYLPRRLRRSDLERGGV